MAERETSRSIDAKAADWIARLDRGPLSHEESEALQAWLDGDPRRRGALLRADALSLLSDSARALGPNFDPDQFADPKVPRSPLISRRKMFAWAGAGSVVAAVAALGMSWPAAAITTGLGEARLVTLEDGSTVMLNTETGIKVRYSDSERRVELLYGEAFFTIAHDLHRPFLVDVDGRRLHATRATFRVRKLDGKPVDILVDQGNVSLGGNGTPAIAMPPSTRLVLPAPVAGQPLPVPQPVEPDQVSRELAWRDGKIAFEGERLDQAAAEFARYSGMRIEIRDAALAREPVTGLFAAGDPMGFSRAVAGIFDAELEQRRDAVVLSRRRGSR